MIGKIVEKGLRDLREGNASIYWAYMTRDGTVLAHDLPEGVHHDTFAIMCATILGAAHTMNSEFPEGDIERIVVEAGRYRVLVNGFDQDTLIALVLLPFIWWRWLQRKPRSALRFSSIAGLQRQRPGFGVRGQHVIPVLRTLAVALLVICLARPEKGNEQTRIYAEGIAIQMVVDVSGSMEQADFVLDGQEATRLDAVKSVFEKFVKGDYA